MDASDTKKCPYCSEQIQAQAVKCKHCGSMLTTARPVSGLTKWGGGILGGFFVLMMIGYCTDQSNEPGTSGQTVTTSAPAVGAPSREVMEFNAKELYAMFHANEVSANQRVGNAIVRFTGTVTKIEQSDFSKTPELDISADDGNEYDDLRADLKPSELSKAATLAKGQQVTLQCDHVSMPVDVYAEGCVLVLTEPDSSDAEAPSATTPQQPPPTPASPPVAEATPSAQPEVPIALQTEAPPADAPQPPAVQPPRSVAQGELPSLGLAKRPQTQSQEQRPADLRRLQDCVHSPEMANVDDRYRLCIQRTGVHP